MKIEWYDVVNINNLTTKYNNNNNLHGLMRYELINRSLDLITIGSVIYSNVFSSVGRLVTCSDDNIQRKFIFGSYTPRCRLESVIPKYSIHTCGD